MLRTRLTGLLLTGGRGDRPDRGKGWWLVAGAPLVERAARALARVADEVVAVGDARLPPEWNVRHVSDEAPGAGPLAAILTGLRRAGADYYVVVAWDMPFVSPDLLRHMIARCQGVNAVVPTRGGQDYPLCAVYTPACASPLAECLARGGDRISDFLAAIRVRRLADPEVARFGDPRKLLLDVDTPEDLALAERLVSADLLGEEAGRGGDE